MMVLVQYRLSSGAYEVISIIEYAHSIVWTERYQDYGEAQVILPLGYDVRLGDVLAIPNRNMSVEVVRITETESQITVICKDSLSVLDRRILVSGISNDGLISTFITKMLNTVIEDTGVRNLPVIRVGDLSEISATAKIQRSYSHLGEALLELGRTYGFNPNARLSDGLLYIDADASSTNRIWGIGRYLSGYTVDEDASDYKNLVYTGGQIVNNARVIVPNFEDSSAPSGMDRYEEWLDRRDVPFENMSLEAVIQNYGEFTTYGQITLQSVLENGVCVDVRCSFVAWIGQMYAGGMSFQSDVIYLKSVLSTSDWQSFKDVWGTGFRLIYTDYNSTDGGWVIPNSDNTDSYLITPDAINSSADYAFENEYSYENVLRAKSIEEASQHSVTDLIEVVTEGTTPYVDYELGDTITVVSESGKRYSGVLREIVESWDSNGYNVTPTIDFSNASE